MNLRLWKRFLLICVGSIMVNLLYGCGGGGGGGGGTTTGGGTLLAAKSVGADGALVNYSSGSMKGGSLYIPPGAVGSSTNITISLLNNPPAFTGGQSSIVVDLGPNGTTFAAPVTVTIPYDKTKIADENNIVVYAYDEASSSWVPEKTVSIDTINKTVSAEVSHFSSRTAQNPPNEMTTRLYTASDGTLVASAVVTTPFDLMTVPIALSSCTGYSNMAEALYYKPGRLWFNYYATLMKYNPGWFDTEVATKKITYKQLVTNAYGNNYHVSVSDDDTFWFASSDNLLTDKFYSWFSGAPALFRFGKTPENGSKYYVKVKLEVDGNLCTLKSNFNFNGQADKTATFSAQTDVDTNRDGITNGYDANTPDITPPSQITGLVASPVSASNISLSWNRSTDNVKVTGYKVYRQQGAFTTTNPNMNTWIKTIYSDSPSYIDTGRAASTYYCYRVTAIDAAANESTYGESCASTTAAPDTTPPTTPTGISAATISKSRIDLAWSSSTDLVGVSGYKIYRDGSFKYATNQTSYSDNGLSSGTNYCYKISAFDAAGNESAKSSEKCSTTIAAPDTAPPSTPTGLTATAISTNQISLAWSPSTDNVMVSGYGIYRGGSYIETVGTTFTSDAGLSPNTQYCYKVLAIDTSANNSPLSSQACATTQPLPTYAISGQVTASGVGLAGVTVATTGGTATTDASGNYSIAGLQNGAYTVTAAAIGYTLSSAQSVAVSGANVTGINFTATVVPATYTISGTITRNGSPLSGVAVTLTGSGSNSTTTNASGVYTFTGVQNGSYTLTPSLSGYLFTPASQLVTVNGANITQDFTGSNTGSITGSW